MKRVILAAIVCLALLAVPSAATTYTTDTTLTASTTTDGSVTIGTTSPGCTVTLQGAGTWDGTLTGMLTIGRSGNAVGALVIDGASLTCAATLWDGYGAPSYAGTLTIQNGGSASFTGTINYVGASAQGTFNISSGSASFSESLYVGYTYGAGNPGTGYVNQTGGAVTINSNKSLFLGASTGTTYSSGTYTISGGSLTVGDTVGGNLGLAPITGASATFHVNGAGASLISCDALVTAAASTTLKFTVDSGAVTPITTRFVNAGGTNNVVEGVVDMATSGSAPTANTYIDLIVRTGSSGTINIDNLTLAPGDATDWKLDNSVAGKVRVGYQLVGEPVANAGPDQNVTDTDDGGFETVTLDGSASSDSDGTIVSYVWSEGSDELASGSDATAEVSLAVGTHTIRLTVTDNDSKTDTDTVQITVHPWDYPPVANAGPDQSVIAGGSGSATVTLNGSASSDADGTITSYVWSDGTDELATGSTASLNLGIGTYTITLTVTDDDGVTAEDQVVVTVSAPPSQLALGAEADSEVRTASPTFNYGAATTLIVREQAPGSSINRAVFRFDLSSITWSIDTAKIRLYVNTAPASNVTHRFWFMSDDTWIEGAGTGQAVAGINWNNCPSATSTSATWAVNTTDANTWKEIDVTSLVQTELAGDKKLSVQVRSDTLVSVIPSYRSRDYSGTTYDPQLVVTTGIPPTANAGPDQNVTDTDASGAETVTLDGSASSDPDGTIQSYVWSEGTTELASGSDATAEVSLAVGTHTITLVVTDDSGKTASDTVVVTVAPWNYPPVANAGPDQTVIDGDNDGSATATLNGSASGDPDGTITSYVWSEGSDELASGSDATASVSLAVGTHTITLTVTDDDGYTAGDTVVVTVSAPPSQFSLYPVADAWIAESNPTYNGGTDPSLYLRKYAGPTDRNEVVLKFDMSAVTWAINTAKLRIRVSVYPGPVDATHRLYRMLDDSWTETGIQWGNAPSDSDAGLTWNIYSATDAGVWKEINVTSLVQTELAGDKILSLRVKADTDYPSPPGGYMAYYSRENSGTTNDPQLVLFTGAAPVADAGPDQTVTDTDDSGAETVTLDGSASSDSDGTITSYVWSEGTTELASGSDATASVSLAVGVHTITLTVTDDGGYTASDTVVVTVAPSNYPPVADAGPDQTVEDSDYSSSETVTLDGSASSDADGTIQSYVWSEGTSQLATGSTAQVDLAVGTHTITLVVTDDDSATAGDTLTIVVEPGPGAPDAALSTVTALPDMNLLANGFDTSKITITLRDSAGKLTDNFTTLSVTSDGSNNTIPAATRISKGLYETTISTTTAETKTVTATVDGSIVVTDTASVVFDPVAPNTKLVYTGDISSGTGTMTIRCEKKSDNSGLWELDLVRQTAGYGAEIRRFDDLVDTAGFNYSGDPTGAGYGGLFLAHHKVFWTIAGCQTSTWSFEELRKEEDSYEYRITVHQKDSAGNPVLDLATLYHIVPSESDGTHWTAHCTLRNVSGATLGSDGFSDRWWASMALGIGGYNSRDYDAVTNPNGGCYLSAYTDNTCTHKQRDDSDAVYEDQDNLDTLVYVPGTDMWAQATVLDNSVTQALGLVAGRTFLMTTELSAAGTTSDRCDVFLGGGPGTGNPNNDALYDHAMPATWGQSSSNPPGALYSKFVRFDFNILDTDSAGGENAPPTANAGPDQEVTAGGSGSATVTLDGSASSDSDGTITSYVWKEGTTEIATGSTAQVDLAVGTHTITLVVTDDDSATAGDDVVVTVTGSATPLDITASVDLDWVYQNTPVTTADRQHCVLTVSFLSKANETEGYDVAFTEDSGTGPGPVTNFTIQTVGGDQYNIVGGRLGSSLPYTFLDPRVYTIEVTYTGQVSGQSDSASVQVTLRMLGDIEGDGDVDAADSAQLRRRLNSLSVPYSDRAFNLTGDLDIYGNPNVSSEDKAVLNRLMNSLPIS